MSAPSANRSEAIESFLADSGWGGAEHATLADDASFRRYERVRRGEDRAVLMDAPPEHEDIRPFIEVSDLLRRLGLSAPAILARDLDNGFLLLEDFGDATMTKLLAAGEDERALYELATDTLIHLHKSFVVHDQAADSLPHYDEELYLKEAALFTDWYWPTVKGAPCPKSERAAFLGLVGNAMTHARGASTTLVLRDYHVDNIMRLDGREGAARCGLLDFQDAVIGPSAYDVVSLLEDARRDVPTEIAKDMMRRYFAAMPTLDPGAFAAAYSALGAQRALKVIGIFTRLDRRDGKSQYLNHIPRVWRWLETDLAHPALTDLRAWVDAAFPPGDRNVPEPKPFGGIE